MSISRSTFVAALVVSLAAASVSADDLAATVAARMKESGTLKGYRVNVKSKAGTVWLEGTVSDAKQIDAAIAVAEEVPGVERIVNRLTVTASDRVSPGLSLPSSVRSLVGLPSPAAEVGAEMAVTPAGDARAASPSAEQALLVDAEASGADAEKQAPIALAQAVVRAPAARQPVVAKPMQRSGQAARPAAQARRGDEGVRRTAMRSQVYDRAIELPGPDGGHVVGEHVAGDGGYPIQGAIGDGQMVPGSMRFTEGPTGGYCPPGQGGMGGPMPMGGGMRGMGGGGGMGGAGGMPVPVRGEGPNMPNYAWPSYAAHPNYAALQYPTQYSPTAWPYIGPFYPYPQVPLGWRRVSLEWDDGWWWLDFDERHVHSHHR